MCVLTVQYNIYIDRVLLIRMSSGFCISSVRQETVVFAETQSLIIFWVKNGNSTVINVTVVKDGDEIKMYMHSHNVG